MPYYAFAEPFFIHAITHLHVGSGSSVEEEIDLPFQRDELGYPTIYASSLKGAIKSFLLKEFPDKRDVIYKVLGEDENPEEASLGTFLDAILFAIPSRIIEIDSAKPYVWVYVTTYELLKKVKLYLDSISQLSNASFSNLKNKIDTILAKEGKNITLDSDLKSAILNEDFYVELEALNNKIPSIINAGVPLLVLEDSIGREVINRSLIRVRRIRIDRDKKVVETGGLWSEEYVPMKTIFFSVLLGKESKESAIFASCILRNLRYVILGGKETIGKGIVELRWVKDVI
ncbi:type III-B CRISPR module RAMP protein Cmr4 [Saccharolobus islandicus]|uniref:CRISPR-associated RAMP protein, Cmr4 family n=1 Tax=Saccharolobus islandicus (strain REY15A) TaxID=930945 RepID=F0NDX6_SACI5|nr:type III-B CRISPR module RAMP protein Cmr4 [Sulfolobus islandicus]6S6B_D Chain D, CRISPR-associated RAMP protein, Cmr4 family [Sulfolobus islandicus REY15A]6S6B_E Chain E, CRISPR-associated RAMP protein, Cmr4 family [Sulfolobus islandicus REY15A]6S6B_F Chain F, CRISPR-associated RAMP protein, Cmr4 family [Sulfolobus islandicus REY15A]6S6B_G Chain G, CRISPR-associated RAMP protein, Cmr4 family [Sulfolobus islandicus REY15A]ADX84685.1 CRISPR-associated RAMP protein, Cmr4 family [Sulfolobus is